MPRSAFGWLSRQPLDHDAWKLWSLVRKGDGRCYLANRFIRAIVLGGCAHLSILAVKFLLGAVLAADSRTARRWRGGAGHPVTTLKKALRHQGWNLDRPWRWTHSTGPVLDLTDPRNNRDLLFHLLRKGWRGYLWQKFCESGRHEADDFAGTTWQDFHNVDLDDSRVGLGLLAQPKQGQSAFSPRSHLLGVKLLTPPAVGAARVGSSPHGIT